MVWGRCGAAHGFYRKLGGSLMQLVVVMITFASSFLQARQTFSVSFYLVSIMYLLFDIEICYLFPYVMCHANAQVWSVDT